jgi:hypothetical protein
MANFFDELTKAGEEAAFVITENLRSYLISSGWPADAANSVQIVRNGSSFTVKYEGPNVAEAQLLEFGSESIRPSASIRKFLNSEASLMSTYMDRIEEKLGDLI